MSTHLRENYIAAHLSRYSKRCLLVYYLRNQDDLFSLVLFRQKTRLAARHPAIPLRSNWFETANRTGSPKGIRTPVAAVRGRCPGPLDDGAGLRTSGVSGSSGASAAPENQTRLDCIRYDSTVSSRNQVAGERNFSAPLKRGSGLEEFECQDNLSFERLDHRAHLADSVDVVSELFFRQTWGLDNIMHPNVCVNPWRGLHAISLDAHIE